MPTHRIFQIDAFTERVFHGNPAAIVPLESWLDDQVMQGIATENNQAETAFLMPVDARMGRYHIRWFTPATEIDLCGHATLAAGHVLWKHLDCQADTITFDSQSGPLTVERRDGVYVMDFPSRPGRKLPVTADIVAALGRLPSELYKARDYMAVFENKRDVHELKPDMQALAKLDALGFIVTAPGAKHDFVCRFFAPRAGIPEDPVTGSAHCTLAPYWVTRLNRSQVSSHQVSRRGGVLSCRVEGDRVKIAGKCVDYLQGTIAV